MSDIAIAARGLGKQYRLGAARPKSAHEALNAIFGRITGRRQPAHGEPFWPIRDCSFDLRFGEVAALIGRNGAGKSVLLKMLSRITKPTEGSAEIHGRLISLLEVGSGFHPDLTGRENIFLNGAILGVRRAEMAGKLDEIVAFAETSRFIDEPVKHYSSGMYMRLAFSIAAHLEADVLLIDEVLAVGDEAFQEKCLDRLRRSRDRGAAILVVSHSMDIVSELCTRGLYIEGGRLAYDGEVAGAVRRYQADE